MRLAGDVEGCLEAVRLLERCAASVDTAQSELAEAVSPQPWTGAAAEVFEGRLLYGRQRLDETAERVVVAARALRHFADGLAELQGRARQLVEEAASSRLVLDDAGWIAPVPVTADPDLQQEQLRRSAVRTAVLHGVRAVQAEYDALHPRLASALGQQVRPTDRVSSWTWDGPWLPGPGDTAAAVLAGARTSLSQVADDGLRRVGRVAGSTGAGAAMTASIELASDQDPADVVLTTAAVPAGAQAGGALAVAGLAGVSLLAAPFAVPAGVGIAVAAGGALAGGYVADRLWGAHGHHVLRTAGRLSPDRLPWVDRPSRRRR
ncbi:hypothetical protein BH24ACT10_BH24ACT10_19950 [soil metagenome]